MYYLTLMVFECHLLLYAGKELAIISFIVNFSFTQRVTELIKVLNDLNKGKYERTMVAGDRSESSLGKFVLFKILYWHL